MDFLFTCQAESNKLAVSELSNLSCGFVIKRWLTPEVGEASIGIDSEQLRYKINNTPLVFMRHIAKTDFVFENEIELLDKGVEHFLNNADKNLSFSVQARYSDKVSFDVGCFASKIESHGFVLDIKKPAQIISLFFCDNKIYFGLDFAENNLSIYKGGMMHFANNDDFVSRAEYKLIEALDTFRIDLAKIKQAADLGAAPGGWTKVLAQNGIKVFAVDPAELSPKVLAMQNIHHYKMTSQQFLRNKKDIKIDLVINDMRIDADESIRVIKEFMPMMSGGGYVIMTLKLHNGYKLKDIKTYLNSFGSFCKLIGARQLFHNRSEITVCCRKK